MDNTETQPTIAALSKRITDLERENGELRSRVRLLDNISDSTGLLTMQAVAKSLNTGPTRLFEFLRRHRAFTKENTPHQQHIEAGRFVVRTGYFYDKGQKTIYSRTYATSRGLQWIGELLATRPAAPAGKED